MAVRRTDAMPLEMFSAEKQAQIAEVVAQDRPPTRWLVGELASIESRAWYEWHWQRGLPPGRVPVTPDLRAAVIARDGLVCALCGGDVALDDLHIDHIRPVSHGGRTELDNLQPAHARCNLKKGARV